MCIQVLTGNPTESMTISHYFFRIFLKTVYYAHYNVDTSGTVVVTSEGRDRVLTTSKEFS